MDKGVAKLFLCSITVVENMLDNNFLGDVSSDSRYDIYHQMSLFNTS
jgi:hypothetical protein